MRSEDAKGLKPVNVAVVGLGFMGATHIKAYRHPALRDSARLAAICSPSGRRLTGDFSDVGGNVGDKEPLKLDMEGIKATKCFEDLLKDPEIDLIDICAPTAAHETLAIAALEAGKHVLCEKPLARTVKAAQGIAMAAKKARGFFMPAMCVRFWPETAWIWQVINEQTYGRLLSAFFRRIAEPPAWGQQNFFNGAESGGALFDLHIHDTDFVHHCFGPPAAVTSVGYTKFSKAIDHVITRYDYESTPGHLLAEGAIIHAEGSWSMSGGFGFSMTSVLNFEHGTVDYDFNRAEPLRVSTGSGPARVIKCDGPDGYVGELQYFVDCIRQKRSPTTVTAEDAVAAVKICEAEERSVLERQTIRL